MGIRKVNVFITLIIFCYFNKVLWIKFSGFILQWELAKILRCVLMERKVGLGSLLCYDLRCWTNNATRSSNETCWGYIVLFMYFISIICFRFCVQMHLG
jgi:hypothetical protein